MNTGIPIEHCDVLNEEIFHDLTINFLGKEKMTISKYYSIRGGYGINMDSVNVINDIGSSLKINFKCRGKNFTKQK